MPIRWRIGSGARPSRCDAEAEGAGVAMLFGGSVARGGDGRGGLRYWYRGVIACALACWVLGAGGSSGIAFGGDGDDGDDADVIPSPLLREYERENARGFEGIEGDVEGVELWRDPVGGGRGDGFGRRVLGRLSGGELWGWGLAGSGFRALSDEDGSEWLSSYPVRTRDAVLDALAGELLSSGVSSLSGEDSFIKGLDVGYQSPLGSRDGSFSVEAVFGLWEGSDALVFGQGGFIVQERGSVWEPGANAGLGYRFLANDILLGANVFFDYLNDDEHGAFRRYSLGAEARGRYWDVSANWYRRLSDVNRTVIDGENYLVYTASGWDAEGAVRLPGWEWLELAVRRYEWEREIGGDIRGFNYRLTARLIQALSLEAEYDYPEGGGDDWGVHLRFSHSWETGDGFASAFSRAGKSSGLVSDAWSRRYERVRRRYEQRIIEERVPASSATDIIALGAGGNEVVEGGSPLMITLSVSGSAGSAGDEYERVFYMKPESGDAVLSPESGVGGDYIVLNSEGESLESSEGVMAVRMSAGVLFVGVMVSALIDGVLDDGEVVTLSLVKAADSDSDSGAIAEGDYAIDRDYGSFAVVIRNAPYLGFEGDSASGSEGEEIRARVIGWDGALWRDNLRINYELIAATADESDYASAGCASGECFSTGSGEAWIDVLLTADEEAEANEDFIVRLLPGEGYEPDANRSEIRVRIAAPLSGARILGDVNSAVWSQADLLRGRVVLDAAANGGEGIIVELSAPLELAAFDDDFRLNLVGDEFACGTLAESNGSLRRVCEVSAEAGDEEIPFFVSADGPVGGYALTVRLIDAEGYAAELSSYEVSVDRAAMALIPTPNSPLMAGGRLELRALSNDLSGVSAGLFNLTLSVSGGNAGDWEILAGGNALSGCRPPDGICLSPYQAGTGGLSAFEFRALRSPVGGVVVTVSLAAGEIGAYSGSSATVTLASAAGVGIANADYSVAEGANQEVRLLIDSPLPPGLIVTIRVESADAIKGDSADAYRLGGDYQLLDGGGDALNCIADGAAFLCDAEIGADGRSAVFEAAAHLDGQTERNERLRLSVVDGDAYIASGGESEIIIANTDFSLAFHLAPTAGDEGDSLRFALRAEGVTLTGGLTVNINTVLAALNPQAIRGEDYDLAIPGCASSGVCQVIADDSASEIVFDVALLPDALSDSPEHFRLLIENGDGYSPSALAASADVRIGGDSPRFGFSQDFAEEYWGREIEAVVEFIPPLSSLYNLRIGIGGGDADDYESVPASVCANGACAISLPSGSAAATLTLMLKAGEAGRRLNLSLIGEPLNYLAFRRETAIAINTPALSFAAAGASANEGDSLRPSIRRNIAVGETFRFHLLPDADLSNDDYSLSGDDIECGEDICTATWPADALDLAITLSASADFIAEGTERLTLSLSADDGYALGGNAIYIASFNDIRPQASFDKAAVNLTEAGAAVRAEIRLTHIPSRDITVSIAVAESGASADDYQLLDESNAPLSCPNGICELTIQANEQAAAFLIHAPLDDDEEGEESVVLSLLAGEQPNAVFGLGSPSQIAVVIADSGLFGYRLSADDVHWNARADVIVEFDPALAAGADIELRASHRLEGQSDLIGGFAASAIPTPLAVGGVVDFACDIGGCSGVIPAGRTSAILRFVAGAVYGGGGLRFNLNASDLPRRRLESNQFDLAVGGSEVRLVGGSANAVEGETTAADIGISPPVSGVSVPLLLQGTNAADHRLRLSGNDLICGALPVGVDALDGRDCGYALSLPASDSAVQFTAVSDGIYEGAEAISFRLSPIAADGFGLADDSGEFILTISDPAVVFVFDGASAFVREGQAITLTATADQSLAIPLIVSITVAAVDAEAADWTIEGCADNADCTIILPPGDNAEVVLTLTAVADADDDDEIIDVRVVKREGVIVGDSMRVTLREDRRMGFGSDVSVPLGQEAAIAINFNPPLPRDANAFIVYLGNDHADRLNAVAVSQDGVSCANADSNARRCTITPSAISDDNAVLADAAISRLMLRLAAEHPSASYSITASLALASLPEGYLISEAAAEAEVSITPLKAEIKTNDANAEIGRDAALTVALDFASPAGFNVSLGISGGEAGQYQLLDSTGGILSGCDAPNGVCAVPIAADTDAAVIALRVLKPGEAEINIAVINYSLGTNAPYIAQGGAAAVGVLSALAAGIAGTDADEGQTAEIKITIPRATPSALPVRMKVSGDAVKGARESAYANGSDYQLFADGAPLNCDDPAPDSAALLCDVIIAANAKAATITLTAHLDGQAEDTESLAFEILADSNAPAYAPSTDANADINIVNTEFAFGFDDASARTSSENRLLELVMSPVGVTLIGGLTVNINTENTGGGLQATRGIDYQIIGCDAAACEFIIGGSDDNLILKVTLLLDSTDESAPEFFRLRIADGEGYAPSPPDFIDVEIADIPRFGFTQSGADQFWGYEGEAVIDFAPPLVSPVRIAASFPAGALSGKLTGGGDFVCDGVQNRCVADIAATESAPVSQAALRLTGHKAGSGEAFDIVLSGDISNYTIAGGGGAAGDRFQFAVSPLNAAIAADGQTAAEGAAAEYHLEVSPPPAESLNVAVRARISQTAINAELRDFEMKDGSGAALICVAAADGESTLCAAPVSALASPDLTATVTVDLTVAISFDADYEPNLEEIIISAEGGEGYAPSASQFIARMQNAPFDLSFANDAYYAAEGARIELNAAVQFAQILDDSFPLSLNIIPHASANAAYGEDYTIAGCGADAIAACELTIAGADRIAEIAVDIIDDGLVEANEFIIVELSAAKVPPPYNLGQTIRATIEISDAAAVGFTGDINPIWGTSEDLIIDFALPLTASAELIMDITGGEHPADFTSSALSCEGAVCTIEANGSSSAPLRRMILDIAPTKAAARKSLQFTLRQAPAGYTLGRRTAKANVGVPIIGWSSAGGSIAEGEFHAVRLAAAPSVDDSFNVNLMRTGEADDGDWSSSNLQAGDVADAFILSVPADSGGADMRIDAAIDGRGEADERLTLTIAPADASADFYDIDSAANPYQLTIANQPVAAHFQSAQAAVAEAGGVNIPLILNPAAQSNLSLRLQLSGDAIYGSDYRLFIGGAEGVREADTDIYAFTMPPGNPPLRLEALLDNQDEDDETANIQILPNAHISPANPSQIAVVIADSGLFGYRLSADDVHWNARADVIVEFDPALAAGADIELRASHRLEGQSDLIGGFAASAIPTPLAVGGVVDFACDIGGCSGVIPAGRTSAILRFVAGAVYGGGGLRFNLNASDLPRRRLESNQFDLAVGGSEVRLVGGSANAVEGETTAADIGISPPVSGVSVPLLLQGTNAADHRLRLGGNDLICGALPVGVDALDGRDCGYALSLPASASAVQFTAVSDGIYEGAEAISFRLSPIAADGFGLGDDSGEFILTISDPAVVFVFDEASAFVREGQAITLTATADQSLAIPLIVSITVDAVDAESADWRIEGCADNADCTIILPPGDNAEVVLTLTAVVDADDDDEIIDVRVVDREGVIDGDTIQVTLREDRRMGFGSDVSVPLGQEAAIAINFNPPIPRAANAFIVHLGNDHADRLNAVAVSQDGVSCANADSNARRCTITPSAISGDDAVLADAAISRLMLRLAAEHPSASYSITVSLALASLPEGYLISEAAAEAEVSITPLKAAIKTDDDANAEIDRDAALTVSLDFASPAEFNVSLGISGGEGGQYQLLDSTGGILSGCDAPNGVCALPIAADTDAAVIALRILKPGEADINIAVINYSLETNAPYIAQGGAAAVGVLSALAAGIAGTDADEGQTAEIKITIPRATPSALPVRMKVSGDAVKGTRESAYANGSDYQLFADGAPLDCPDDPAPDSAALLCDVIIAANAKAATITLTAHLDGQAEDTESLAFEILADSNAPAYAPSTDANADINIVNTEFAFGFDDASARTSSENRLLELVMSPVGVTLIGGLTVNINAENTGGGLQATRGIDYQIIGCDAAACEFIIGGSDDNLILKVTLLLDSTDESAPEFFRLRIADGEGYAPSPPDFIDVEIADIPRFGFTQSGADQFWGYEGEAVIDFAPPLVSPVRIAASFPAGALSGKLTGGGDFVCDGVQNRCVADIAASESAPVSQAALRLTGHKAGSGEAFDIVLSGDISDYTIAGGGGAAGDRFRFAVNPLNAAIAADGQTAAEGAAAEYHLEVSPPPAESLNVAVRARISQTAINAELRDFEMKDGNGAALICVAAADGESTLCAAPVSASASPDLTATVTVYLTVTISFDADYEPNLEEIIISAEGGEGYAPSASQFIARMQNAPFDLSFANDAYYAAEGARIELNAAVQFAQVLDDSFPLSLNIIPHASANAAYGEDYTIAGCGADAIAACELTIADADRIAEIAVDIIDDGLVEANEFIIVELSAAKVPPPYNLGQTIRATIEISDAAAIGFTGNINPIWGTSEDLIIDFALPLTASAELIMDITGGEYPADFTSSALSCEEAVCTIEANGSSSAPLRRMILDIAPTKAAARKSLQFTLRQAPAGYTLGRRTAKANVGVPIIGWSSAGGSIAEGEFHAVRLAAAPSVDDSFNVNLMRTGEADDGDWSSSNLQAGDVADAFILSVPADSGGADMRIDAAIDGRGEADERLTLTIAPADASADFYDIDSAANPYQLTIANQPVAAHFQSAQAAVAEAGGVNIPLILNPAAQSNLSLRLQLSGDAIYGSDYRLFIGGAEGVREADTDIYAFTMPPGNPPLRLEALLDNQDEDDETANIQILPNAHISPANPSQIAVVIADSGLFGYRLSADDVHWNARADVIVEFDPALAAGADIELRASHRLEGQSDLIGGFAASAIPTPLAVGGVVDFACDIGGCSGVIPAGRTSAILRFVAGAVYGGGGLRFNLNASDLPRRRLESNQFDLAVGGSEVRLVGGSANAVEGETTAADIGISPPVSGVSVPLLLQGTNAADHRLRLSGNDLICGALPVGVDALDGRDCGYALSLPASASAVQFIQFTAVSDGIYEGAEAISFRLSPIAADGFGLADDSGEFILTISDPAVVFVFDGASAFVREGQAITLTATADQSLAIPLIVSITVAAVDAEAADWTIEGCADNADCTIILPPGDNAEVVLTLTAVADADDDDEIIDVRVVKREGVIVGDSMRVTLREGSPHGLRF